MGGTALMSPHTSGTLISHKSVHPNRQDAVGLGAQQCALVPLSMLGIPQMEELATHWLPVYRKDMG